MIAVVDYGMGNLRSVAKALEAIGEEPRVTRDSADLRAASHIVLPGVGAFAQCIANLRATGLVDVLDEEVRGKKKPFLGICLGMQLLAADSEEGGRHEGLGWFPASVRRLDGDVRLKVPHIGWNDVDARAGSPLFRGVRRPVFYFVHSYYMDCADPSLVSATCDYGVTFPAAVVADNVWAVQFHPEKSQVNGLRFLQNFLSRS
jgi:imidazole glycerol-phosphate synthase subunit HisH